MVDTSNISSRDNIRRDKSKLSLLMAAIISVSTLVIVVFFSFLPNIIKMPLTKYKLAFAVIVTREDVPYVYPLTKVRVAKNQYKVKMQTDPTRDSDTVKEFLSTSRKYYIYDFKVGSMKEINLDDVLSMTYYINPNLGFTEHISTFCDDSPDGYKLESTVYYDSGPYRDNPGLMNYPDEEKGVYIKNFFVRSKFYDGYISECFGWTM